MTRFYTLVLCFISVVACSGEEQAGGEANQATHAPLSASSLPTAADIRKACDVAVWETIRSSEEIGIVHPTYHPYVVRAPHCQWDQGRTRALCHFEQAEIEIEFATAEEIAEALPMLRDRDWKPMRAQLVHAGTGWKAPAGCHRADELSLFSVVDVDALLGETGSCVNGGGSHSRQCNHGRPTRVKLVHGDIEKLLGRR